MSRSRARLLLAAAGLLVGLPACRTNIRPQKRPSATVYVGDKSCEVFDFPAATDVPEGAKSLGWVEVKRLERDEDTYVALRTRICELGGDALSQISWVREADDYEPSKLRAHAWVLP